MAIKFDKIGYWSEIKLEIIRRYAAEYSKIVAAQGRFSHCYVDAFAGPGRHERKDDGVEVLGSPLVALNVSPPFDEYWFIDLAQEKIDYLGEQIGDRPNVHLETGDCNKILLRNVLPTLRYEDFRRALILLDPYGLHLDWRVVREAAKLRSTELFINFPVMDMNRNVFWRNPEGVDQRDLRRMSIWWGDESWRDVAYTTETTLFAFPEKTDNETIAKGYQRRLKSVAGFNYVPDPLPMRNKGGAIVYYLYFASQNAVGGKIVGQIFDRFRGRGST